MVKTYSRNQKTVALPSGEAELYVVVSGVAEGIGIQSVTTDYGFTCDFQRLSDSSAAIAMTRRVGIGKVRQPQPPYLWIQELVSNSKVSMFKIGTNSNLADLFATYVDSNETKRP